jgi:hypothetical protein
MNSETGIDSLINSYKNVLGNVILAGPTQFSEIFQVINLKPTHHDMYYKVCVFITDGEP